MSLLFGLTDFLVTESDYLTPLPEIAYTTLSAAYLISLNA